MTTGKTIALIRPTFVDRLTGKCETRGPQNLGNLYFFQALSPQPLQLLTEKTGKSPKLGLSCCRARRVGESFCGRGIKYWLDLSLLPSMGEKKTKLLIFRRKVHQALLPLRHWRKLIANGWKEQKQKIRDGYGSDSKESACNAGDQGSISGLERSPGGGHSNPVQYSCLENFMDRGAWRATVHGVAKSWKPLSD